MIIRHPRRDGEFAFAFITGQTVLQVGMGVDRVGVQNGDSSYS